MDEINSVVARLLLEPTSIFAMTDDSFLLSFHIAPLSRVNLFDIRIYWPAVQHYDVTGRRGGKNGRTGVTSNLKSPVFLFIVSLSHGRRKRLSPFSFKRKPLTQETDGGVSAP